MDQAVVLRKLKKSTKGPMLPIEGRISPVPVKQQAIRDNVRVISITSGKGGVGKTNITVNLAYLLAKMKKKTLILDADTGLANIDVILGLTPKYNLFHVLNGEKTMREALIQGPGGIMILPAASGIQEMSDLSKGQKFTLLDELRTVSGDMDFLLIDTAAGIAGNVMYFNMAADEIIVVASPEPTSLTDAYAIIKVLYQKHAKRYFRLLVNMVRDPREGREVYQRLNQATDRFLNLNIEYLGYILRDDKLSEAVKQQEAFTKLYPDSPASKCLLTVAEKLRDEQPAGSDKGGISFFWERIIERDCG
ncbi:MAG: MinD/ParA family protein [Syntrophales bacterium]